MQPEVGAVQSYFSKLGFEPEIATLYLALHTHGAQSISELSRNSGVERTRIYRLIDKLMDSNLIEVESHYKKGVIKAAPIANINILISQREQELKSLQDELSLIEQLLARNSLSSPATRVQFYNGAAGIKQMYWNETKAKSEVICLLHENMQLRTDSRFFERWAQQCNEKDMHFRGIINDSFIASQKLWYTHHTTERLKNWQAHYISSDKFAITHGTIIYDDVVGYFNWKDDEVFGVEIYNAHIAETQRQLFELLWQQSQPHAD